MAKTKTKKKITKPLLDGMTMCPTHRAHRRPFLGPKLGAKL